MRGPPPRPSVSMPRPLTGSQITMPPSDVTPFA